MPFSDEKYKFFETFSATKTADVMAQVDLYQNSNNYSYILKNHTNFESEFSQLFSVLQQEKDKDREKFWLYCYYCATMLEIYHKAYSQYSKEEEFRQIREKIKQRLSGNTKNDRQGIVEEETFINSLLQSYSNSIYNILNAPFHTSKLRDYIVYLNLARMYWAFCRLTIVSGLNAARDIIQQLDILLGTQTDVDQIIANIQAPTAFLNYFSVGLFIARFVIDVGMLIKHTFIPSEKESEASMLERFKHELYKRHCNYTNDIVWAVVNFLTNYNELVGISNAAAGNLIAVFLMFDICMMFYKLNLAEENYLTKLAQYEEERVKYKDLSISSMPHLEILEKQIEELRINWQTTEESLHYGALAAGFLFSGFSAALLLSNPVLITLGFFTSSFGAAMYRSFDSYTAYTNASLYLEQAEDNNGNIKAATIKCDAAYNQFVYTLAENSTMPLLFVTAFSINLPAALLLTAMFLSYKLYHANDQFQSEQTVRQLMS